MNKHYKTILFIFLIIISYSPALFAICELGFTERIFNFGHVGIDYKIYHNYYIYNIGQKSYKLDSINTNCDCSYAISSDSIINPNDTITIKLEFNTANYYGFNNKQISVYTNYSTLPKLSFPYKSIVGQWPAGVKPDPISLFFLPNHKTKKISIPNPVLDNIKLDDILKFDSTFSIKILKDEAKRGEKIELSVDPISNLSKGTYYSNFTLYIDAIPDKGKIILTIPIKIVRY
ncbi:MAG: hypothetical protein DRP35_06595 [Candidatus Zixiibacteriota bacterium]|nr:MAG: hypothetical protein DRP35_06595 [candidate division Zixibacteria bacterium]